MMWRRCTWVQSMAPPPSSPWCSAGAGAISTDAIGEKPFSQQRLAWVEDLGHEFVLSTLVCAVATVVGLQGFWPHPHQDPDFIYNTYGVLGFLVGAKLLSYLYAVFPSLTGR